MKLWLIRHAQPLVAAGTCYGSCDVAADANATAQAAKALATELPQGLALRCSPLQRCEQQSTYLRGLRPDLTSFSDPRLAEMDFGAWEGRRWDAIAPAELAAWTAGFWDYRPGGGESVAMFMARVALAFDETRQRDRDCAWITHAGVIRAVTLLAAGTRQVRDAAQWPIEAPGFGDWTILEL